MEELEFRTDAKGTVFYEEGMVREKRLTKFSTEIIEYVLALIKKRFPESYSRLAILYEKEEPTEKRYIMAERFIRCNFGADDHLTPDIQNTILNFEEVRCPLRGMCKEEGIICKPKGLVSLSAKEKETAKLYIEGLTFKEIAEILRKNPSTIKNQLWKIKKKLGVTNCREIIKVMRLSSCIL